MRRHVNSNWAMTSSRAHQVLSRFESAIHSDFDRHARTSCASAILGTRVNSKLDAKLNSNWPKTKLFAAVPKRTFGTKKKEGMRAGSPAGTDSQPSVDGGQQPSSIHLRDVRR